MKVLAIAGIATAVVVAIGLTVAIVLLGPVEQESLEKEISFTILHINDFHARFEPISASGSTCQAGNNEQGLCYGGIARVYSAITEQRQLRVNPVVLNAGDNYQGTLMYSLFKWNITLEFMQRLNFDATAFGNHEFDDKVAGIVPFVDGLKSPMVAANMDASLEPTLDGKFVPSVTIYRDKTKIGIIGCISKETPALSSPENLIFNDEIESVSAEVKKLKADGVKIIILLSHSGYDVDLIIAEQIPELDVIVGGHSHTFLYSGTPPTTDEPVDEYPKVVPHRNGGKTLIVQAMAFGKYLGILELKFDKAGEVESWSGNPILLDSSVPEDESTTELLSPYREEADVIGGQTLGTSAVLLDSSTCYNKECNLGNFLTDAIVHEYTELINDDAWTTVAIAIMNPGGIRAPMGESANVTFNDLITAQPFQNTIDTVELQGKDIVELMELAASPPLNKIRAKDFADGAGCFQVSGIRAKYDMSQAEGSRLVDIALKCSKCVTPEFLPVNSEEWYTVAMPSFLASGNSFPLITERGRNRTIGRLDMDVYVDYIKTKNPIMTGIEHRITVL